MPRLTKGFTQQDGTPSRTTPEEKGDSDKFPAPGYSFGKFSTLPPRKASGSAQSDQRPLPSRVGASSSHQRRKASMSKLMRHFGETNIPADLFPSPLDQSVVADTSEETQMPSLRKQRTRSLDLSTLSKSPILQVSDPVTEKKARPLHRTHSLGSRKDQRISEDLDLWEGRTAESAQNRVKRMRKMAQIFGPEVSYQLMVNPTLQQKQANSDEPFRSEDRLGGEAESVFQLRRLSPNLGLFSMGFVEDDHSSPLSPIPPTPPIAATPPVSISPTPPILPTPPASPTKERHRRTQKLAKFFGVSQLDISSSISSSVTMQDIRHTASNSSSVSSKLPSRDVEVNVKVAGRRLWALSPDRAEFKTAEMADAIEQLRTLKAG
ncbi:hypothetical protein MD484_g1388, partial [Candolleomyces efflorescens]